MTILGLECEQNVGAGLLANAVYQSEYLLLTDRIREQAPSHIGSLALVRTYQGAIPVRDRAKTPNCPAWTARH